MKTLSLAVSAVALLVASPVQAGDFSGPYVGIIGSYSDDNLSVDLLKLNGVALKGATQSTNLNGGLFGVQAGYGRQIGQFYIGAETDWQWGDLDQDIANGGFNTTYSMDQMATLRARLGYVVGDFMPYVTGGVALEHGTIGAYVPGSPPPLSVEASSWDVGFAVGGGLEWKPFEHVSFKIDALYTDFGTHDLASANVLGTHADLVSVDNTGTQVRFGAAYHF